MFHPEIIAASVAAIEAQTGVALVERPVADCVRVYDHFSALTRTDGKHSWYQRVGQSAEEFAFADWEREWIANEMYLCACSFPYFYWRYYFIKTKEGHIKRPDQLIAQLIFLAILAELDLKHLPILLLILKARQLGMSTIIEGIILWIALFRRGCHTVIASAEEDKSIEMSNMVWLGIDYLPLWMKPVLTRDDRKVGPEFGENESDILIQHGAMSKGISRGSTPTAAHLSEVAYYPNPIETIESSLIRAMHENPRTFLALESTARRKGDWFHKTWIKNREGEASGYNRFTCLFLPWYVGSDKYPTPDWLRNHPVPAEWRPRRETVKQAADARLYVATTPLLRQHMPPAWEMPREQQWFWEFNYVEASADDETLKSFMAEMAADERSCFTSKRWSVYTQEVLERVRTETSDKYTDYAIIGDGIDIQFHLRDYWSVKAKRVEIQYLSIRDCCLSWKLVPLRETPREPELQCYLRVWEPPRPGYRYTIGIDVGGGVGQNNTDFEVLRVGRNADDPDVQVAQLRSPWLNAAQAPPFALALGAWYGQHMSPVPEAYMAPETQISVGDLISSQLANDGYSNFHYMERYDLRKSPGHKSRRRGWATNAWSRPLMEQTLKNAVDLGWLSINSLDTAEELENQEAEETDSGKTKFDHAKGETDDSLIALGIAVFVSHDEETRTERLQRKITPKRKGDLDAKPPELDTSEAMLARHFQREEQWDMEQGDEERSRYVY